MLLLIIGLTILLGVHVVPAFSSFRSSLIDRFGPLVYRGLFSIGSILGLILVIWGYSEARLDPIVLYDPPIWMRHVTLLLMLPVFIFLIAAYLPGKIRSTLKHPMLIGIKLWAFAHLLANGTLPDLLLFGSILAWAIFDLRSEKRRGATGPTITAEESVRNDVISVVGGLTIYIIFVLWAHSYLIGVPVWPR